MIVEKLKYDEEIGKYFEIKLDENGSKVLLKEGKEFNGKLELVYENGRLHSEGIIEKGLKEGLWKTYYEIDEEEKDNKLFGIFKRKDNKRGKLKIEEFFKKGKREGKYYEYHENGEKSVELEYKNDKLDGNYFVYHKNGKKKIEGFYKEDLKEGNWYQYDWKEIMIDKINYVHDKAEGLAYGYYENGNVKAVVHYRNGEKNGRYEEYTENGILRVEGRYENDIKEGKWREYKKKTGKIFLTYEMQKGKMEGYYKMYYGLGDRVNKIEAILTHPNEEAPLDEVYEMKDGKKEGKYIKYYPNGKKWEEGQFKDDKKEGIFYSYSKNGEIIVKRIYESGFYTEKIGYFDYDEQKISSRTRHWKEEEGEYYETTIYYPNGNIEEKSLRLDDGENDRDLELIKYDEDGKITYEKQYRKRF